MIATLQLCENLLKDRMICIHLLVHRAELHKHEGGPLKILRRVELQHRAFEQGEERIVVVEGLSFHLFFLASFFLGPTKTGTCRARPGSYRAAGS